ncbi:MAG: hypothetical protein MUO68_04580 [Desulfobacteraceae bacterium]|nr:hypothetical protein [Desulfobacteraceae bacterium]
MKAAILFTGGGPVLFSTSFRLWFRGILFMGDSPQWVVMPYMGEGYERKVVFEI